MLNDVVINRKIPMRVYFYLLCINIGPSFCAVVSLLAAGMVFFIWDEGMTVFHFVVLIISILIWSIEAMRRVLISMSHVYLK